MDISSASACGNNRRPRTGWDLDGAPGGMITAGVGGPITGRGADLLIVDDPVQERRAGGQPGVSREGLGLVALDRVYTTRARRRGGHRADPLARRRFGGPRAARAVGRKLARRPTAGVRREGRPAGPRRGRSRFGPSGLGRPSWKRNAARCRPTGGKGSTSSGRENSPA